jgi:xylulokinase
MSVSRHAVEGRWGALRSMGGVGASLEWFLDNLWTGTDASFEREEQYGAINRSVGQSPPGAKGLLFFPLAGGHAPAIAHTRGAFVGLSLAHNRDDMARAVMEGISLELRWVIQQICEAGLSVSELTMVGGPAQSPVWPQIVADVTGLPVRLPSFQQAACRGAAILAGTGAGLFADPVAGFGAFRSGQDMRTPQPDRRSLYDDGFDRYQQFHSLLM